MRLEGSALDGTGKPAPASESSITKDVAPVAPRFESSFTPAHQTRVSAPVSPPLALTREVARAFGVQRLGEKVRESIERGLQVLETSGRCATTNGRVQLV